MKNIKTFLIGFLTCCCMFLIMGQTEGGWNQIGRYQGFSYDRFGIYLIDTSTGQMWLKQTNDDGLKYVDLNIGFEN